MEAYNAAKLISLLGGPSLDQQELERLNDLETGKVLLAWLCDQISGADDESLLNAEKGPRPDIHAYDGEEQERRIYAAMRDSVLERDEVVIANRAKLQEPVNGSEAENANVLPTNYMPPSLLKKYANFVNSETDIVHRQTELLRARISASKVASKKLAQSIKLLQQSVYELDSKINRSDERLSELSITADNTIDSTLSQCQGLMRDLGYSERKKESSDPPLPANPEVPLVNEDLDLQSARNVVLNAKKNMSTLTSILKANLQDFTLSRQDELARIADVQLEAERLQKAFDDIPAQQSQYKAEEERHTIKELEHICGILEREADLQDADTKYESQALSNLLSELEERSEENSQQQQATDVHEILRQAWARDQAVILRTHEGALDEALSSLDRILKPLELVYASLSALVHCVHEAEALLEAFIEEMGDINLSNSTNQEAQNLESEGDPKLIEELTDVLTRNKDLRPFDSAPLLLLDHKDILEEVRSLKARSMGLETSERKWADDLLRISCNRPIHPALPHIYANSTTNMLPPFAFPAYVRDLESQARKKATELQVLASSLEEEVRETFAKESTRKRLSTFVDKWCE